MKTLCVFFAMLNMFLSSAQADMNGDMDAVYRSQRSKTIDEQYQNAVDRRTKDSRDKEIFELQKQLLKKQIESGNLSAAKGTLNEIQDFQSEKEAASFQKKDPKVTCTTKSMMSGQLTTECENSEN